MTCLKFEDPLSWRISKYFAKKETNNISLDYLITTSKTIFIFFDCQTLTCKIINIFSKSKPGSVVTASSLV